MIRLQKYISDCGITSRRKAEELILQGKVRVNGEIVTLLGTRIEECTDRVTVSGKEIKKTPQKIYVMLNKPKGCITSVSDPQGRNTVFTYLTDIRERIYPVGRLDYDTEGLLLLTNDGDFAFRLAHPKHQVEKTYVASMKGKPTPDLLKKLSQGIPIEDYIAKANEVRLLSFDEKSSKVLITIAQGKNRQVRKMFEAIGYPLIGLKRISIGTLKLSKLSPGKWRYLNRQEANQIFQ